MRAGYFYLIALLVVILDQITKYAAISRLTLGSSMPVIGDAVSLTLVHNQGGAFGLFQSWAGALTLITIIVVAAIIVVMRRGVTMPRLVMLALALQLGGAVGNLIDRIRFHYVIDFVDLHVWPVFNLADSAITIGICLLAYYLFFHEGRAEKKALAPDQMTEG